MSASAGVVTPRLCAASGAAKRAAMRRAEAAAVSEPSVLARAQAGEREAFDLLLSGYRDRVLDLAYALLYSRDDAEDAAQEVFARAFVAIGSFRAEAGLWTWLYRITVNECLRRKKRLASMGRADAEIDSCGGDSAARIESQLAVRQALDSLPPKLRVTLILREMQGLSYEEIALTLRVPVGTVRSRLAEARRLFRLAYGANETDP